MNSIIRFVPALAVLALVTACGGGGGSSDATATPSTTTPTPTPVVATDSSRYAGTWALCRSSGATSSERETLAFTATSATTLAFTETNTAFASLNCAGAAGTTKTNTGTASFTGTKTVGTDTVDKVIVTQGTQTQKQIVLVTATTLRTGKAAEDGGVVDADGYPTTLETNAFTKQ